MYIHHVNFCQLKHELEQDEKRQELLEELRDYHNLKTFWSDIHIKTLYRQCNEVELKSSGKFGRWCTCRRRIIDLPHKSYTHAYHSVVVHKEVLNLGFGLRNYKEELEHAKVTRWFLYGF